MKFCPECNARIAYKSYSTDIVHTCKTGNDVLDTEPVLKKGNYIDEATGSEVQVDNPNLQGMPNKLQGTIAGLDGQDLEELNVHGKRKSLYRTRQKYKYIRLK